MFPHRGRPHRVLCLVCLWGCHLGDLYSQDVMGALPCAVVLDCPGLMFSVGDVTSLCVDGSLRYYLSRSPNVCISWIIGCVCSVCVSVTALCDACYHV